MNKQQEVEELSAKVDALMDDVEALSEQQFNPGPLRADIAALQAIVAVMVSDRHEDHAFRANVGRVIDHLTKQLPAAESEALRQSVALLMDH